MNAKDSLRRAIRLALGGAVALATSLPVSTALAQDADEEIIVIGSRIARDSDFQSPSPVLEVSREDIERLGYSNLQQLFEKIPANGNGAFSTRGNNQDSTANGAASISLRGLGADATLVLVNGRRVSISPFAESITTSFVDINSIPVSAIERVEVLKDGASAVYGSDAVAGVVNIVLRRNFLGFETAVGYGNTTESDYAETTASAIWGSGGDDSNVTIILDYFKNDNLLNTDRGTLGTANQLAQGGFDLRSSRSWPGSFIVDDTPTIDPTCPPDRASGATCFFDYGPFNILTPEAERTGLMLLGHAGLGSDLEFFTEIGVQHNTSLAQGAPTPLDGDAGLTVPASHPNNPFTTSNPIGIRRFRTVDAGPRRWHIESDNLRVVAGLRGSVSDWDWEVAGQRARAESMQTGERGDGWVRTDFLQQQIDLGLYNPFGTTINSPEVIDAITTSLVRRGEANLKMFDAQITGSLFDMPAGPVKMAAGAERRSESVSDIPDDQFQRGLIFGTEAVTAEASRKSWSAFVEFAIPLLETVELSLAGRYDDYDDFGDTSNPKVALRWAPTENLALRASWGTGFRAPSLAQVGLGPSDESQFFADTFGCADNSVYCGVLDYTIRFAGNPDLDPEKSENFNFGVAWQSDAFTATLDYWDIKQEEKIDELPFGLVYQAECNDQNSPICERGAPLPGDTLGPLERIHSTFINIGEQSVSGIDLAGYFNIGVAGGQLVLGLTYSHLLDFERVELSPSGDTLLSRELTGEYEYPEDRAMLTADWGTDKWGVFANVNYIGEFEDTPDILPIGEAPDGVLDYDQVTTPKVDAFTTLNLQFRYTGIENMKFLLGIDNVLDEDAPFAGGDGDTDLYGYVQSQHSPRGRFWNVKAIFDF